LLDSLLQEFQIKDNVVHQNDLDIHVLLLGGILKENYVELYR